MTPAARAAVVGILAALTLLGLAGGAFLLVRGDGSSARAVTDPATGDGALTLQYLDVRVDVPDDWTPLDTGGCETEFSRWGPAGSLPCDPDSDGVTFLGSATFDAVQGPGVTRGERDGERVWSGYVVVGDVAIQAATPNKQLTTAILVSAREAGTPR